MQSSMYSYYCDQFVLPLPAGHRFPMSKYQLLRERVARELPHVILQEPPAASNGQLALAHHPSYIERMASGLLTTQEQRALGFPWSLPMVERARRSTGATIAACEAALKHGFAANLAGGTHHAYSDRGEGFCCFNDIAVAARLMQAKGLAKRIAVIDLDVHQGNGTAAILGTDDNIFTLSIHAQSNYPFKKETSTLDIGLVDGTGDDDYLAKLDQALQAVEAHMTPDLIIYLAGADIYEADRLGRLKITMAGCLARDQRVLSFARRVGAPVAAVMGGGYCPNIEETVAVHFQTIAALAHESIQ